MTMSATPRSGVAGARTPLSRDRVLTAALALVDREGLSMLSLRRLAADLDVEAMAIYRYASSKAELLEGLVEKMLAPLAEIDLDGEWRPQLHAFASEFRRLALAHPHVLPLVATRPLATPLSRRPLAVLMHSERILDVFCRAGLDDRAAAAAYRRFVAYLLGQMLVELREVVDDPDETDPAARYGLHRLPASEFPRLRSLASTLADPDPDADLHRGLDDLLDAIARDGIAH